MGIHSALNLCQSPRSSQRCAAGTSCSERIGTYLRCKQGTYLRCKQNQTYVRTQAASSVMHDVLNVNSVISFLLKNLLIHPTALE